MFHPLAPDLKDLSTDELHSKYNDLMNRMNQAYRFGPTGIIPQLQMMQSHYQNEIQNRNAKQVETMQKNSKNFNKIIDIK